MGVSRSGVSDSMNSGTRYHQASSAAPDAASLPALGPAAAGLSHVPRSMRVRLGSLAYGVQLKEPKVIAGKQLPMKLSANEPVQASSVAPEIGSV